MGRPPKLSMPTADAAVGPGQREAILAAAVSLFATEGYNGTTMRDIANAVGILPGSLYAHIASKEMLLVEIVLDGQERFLALEPLVKQSLLSPVEKLQMAIGAHVATVAEYPERSLVVFHQWRFLSEPNRQLSLAKRRRYVKLFRNIVSQAIDAREFDPQLNTRIAVFGILGAMNWTPEWFSHHGPESAKEVANSLTQSLIQGLINRGA